MEDRHRFGLTRLPAALWVLVATLAFGAVSAAEPLRGVDVRTGRPTEVRLDAPATHLVYLAGWCPPCLAQVEELREWEARYGADGYRLVIVAVGRRQTVERVEKLVRDRDLPGTVLFDADGALEARWSVTAVPHHVLVDARGNPVWTADEPNRSLATAVERLLDSAAGGGR